MNKKSQISTLFQQQSGVKHSLFAGRANTLLYAFFKTLPKGSAIIVPAIMCPSPLFVAEYAGITCYLCDVDLNTGLLDFHAVKKIIAQRPDSIKAILSVNLYGARPDNQLIYPFCQKNQIYLIEDAAQGWDFKHLNQDVDLAILSFGAKKTIDLGGGGMLLTNNKALLQQISVELEQLACTDSATIAALAAYYAQQYYLLQEMEQSFPGAQQVFHHYGKLFKPLYFPDKNQIDSDKLFETLTTFAEQLTNRHYWLEQYQQLFQQFPQFSRVTTKQMAGCCWRYSVRFNPQQRETLANYLREQAIDVSCWYPNLAKLGFNNAYLTANKNNEFGDSVMNFWIDDMSQEKLTTLANVLNSYFKGEQ